MIEEHERHWQTDDFAKDRTRSLITCISALVATVGTAAFAIWMGWL